MAISELACTYAALILHDEGIPITAEKISTLVKSANVNIEAYWPGLFAKLFQKRSVDDLIASAAGGGGGGGPVAVSAPAGGAAAAPAAEAAVEKKEEPKKEEEKEESDDDMGFSLFD